VATDRNTGVLLAIQDLSAPQIQNITINEFWEAFDGMFYPFKNTTDNSTSGDPGPEETLTKWLAAALQLQPGSLASYLSEPREIIQNIFMMPLYLYNPLIDGSELSPIPSPWDVKPGLPQENYINGSFARAVDHLEISQWTAICYVAVGGFLLLFILLVLALTAGNQAQKTSDYPVVDFLALERTSFSSGDAPGNEGVRPGGHDKSDVAEIFVGCAAGDNRAILEASRGVRISA